MALSCGVGVGLILLRSNTKNGAGRMEFGQLSGKDALLGNLPILARRNAQSTGRKISNFSAALDSVQSPVTIAADQE